MPSRSRTQLEQTSVALSSSVGGAAGARCIPHRLELPQILVVFETRDLEQLTLLPVERHRDRPRTGVDHRIGDSGLVLNRARVNWFEPFHDRLSMAHDV